MTGELHKVTDQSKKSTKMRGWLLGQHGWTKVKALPSFGGRMKVKALICSKSVFFFFVILVMILVCSGAEYHRTKFLKKSRIGRQICFGSLSCYEVLRFGCCRLIGLKWRKVMAVGRYWRPGGDFSNGHNSLRRTFENWMGCI